MFVFEFVDDDVRVTIEPGASVTDTLEPLGSIPFGCDAGHCAACAITVLEGGQAGLNPPTDREHYTLTDAEIDAGARLACQLIVLGDGHARVRSFW